MPGARRTPHPTQVFTCARSQEDLSVRLEEWRAKGYDVNGCVADVSDRTQREQLTAEVSAAFGGRLHVLGTPASRIQL